MRICLLIVISVWGVLSAVAQDMKSVFVSMPDSIAPLLTKVNKEDCIDFLDSGMKAEVRNRFNNVAEMKVLTEDYVLMQTTAHSSLEMKLLPVNDSTKIVCMVKTVCASACDSEVHFYASDWSEEWSAKEYIQLPDPDVFYVPVDSITEDYVQIRRRADMCLLKASLSKDDESISFIYSTPDYLNQEDKEKLLPYLRKAPLVFQWKDGKFR